MRTIVDVPEQGLQAIKQVVQQEHTQAEMLRGTVRLDPEACRQEIEPEAFGIWRGRQEHDLSADPVGGAVKALFDTNILIDYLNGVARVREELQRYQQRLISLVTQVEILVGCKDGQEEPDS